MPIRFRRTLKIAPGVKVNFSKSGISTTVGPKGFHFTFNKRGVRRDVSIPGTGISEVDYIKKNKTEAEKEKEKKAEGHREASAEEGSVEKKQTRSERAVPVTGVAARRRQALRVPSTGLRNFFVLLAVVVFFFVGATMLGLVPAHLLSNALQYVARLIQSTGH